MSNVPAGIPQLLSTGEVAKAFNRLPRRAKYMLERDFLPFVWEGGRRKVRAADLAEYAERLGIPLDWEAVIC